MSELKKKYRGLPLSPIVRIMKDEITKLTNEKLNVNKEAKHFMLELVEEFIRQTIREVLSEDFRRSRKTISADELHRALRLPPDVSNLRTDILKNCWRKMEDKFSKNKVLND